MKPQKKSSGVYVLEGSSDADYIWIDDMVYPEALEIAEPGTSIKEIVGDTTIEAHFDTEDGSAFPDVLTGFQLMPLVSHGFLSFVKEHFVSDFNALEHFNISLFEIGNEKKPVEQTYYMLNALGTFDFIDWEKSVVKAFQGNEIREIQHIKVKKNIRLLKNIFRVKGIEEFICVSQLFKDLLDQTNLKGVNCVPLESFTDLIFKEEPIVQPGAIRMPQSGLEAINELEKRVGDGGQVRPKSFKSPTIFKE